MPETPVGPINAATPTPLTPEGRLDHSSARRLARRWRDVGLDGVMILGSMGEGLRLCDKVRDAFVELATAEAGDKLIIFATAADVSRERMRERAIRYAAMGAHYIVLSLPPAMPARKAIHEVKAVADSCPIPCCYYEAPENTGTALVLEEIVEIVAHPNIRLMKDSSGNSLLAQAITSPAGRINGAQFFDGTEYRAAYSFALGYDGVLHGGGVLTGRLVREIWRRAVAGRMQEAMDLDRRNAIFLGGVYNRFSRPLQNVAGQKYALKLLGVLDHDAVLVDQRLDEASHRRIAAAVEENRCWLE